MYECSEAVTVVQFERSSQEYRMTVIRGCSWEASHNRYLTERNAPENRATDVRIPENRMPEGLAIQPNDIVCRGVASGIFRREDLERYEHFTVTEVQDNRHGRFLRHWAVIGA